MTRTILGYHRAPPDESHVAELAGERIPPESEERVAETQAYRRRAAEQWRCGAA
ncbi:MAG: hypothetical protein ACYCU7_18085 [Acidimicrobiales bacterium]